MSVSKRGELKRWYIHIRPQGRLVNLRTLAITKVEAKQTEQAIMTAIRSGDYGGLNPSERETCIRLFNNQGWAKPTGLKLEPEPVDELTLSRAITICLGYPGIADSPNKERYMQCLAHFLEKWGPDKPIKSVWVPEIRLYEQERLLEADPKTGRKLASPATVNKERGVLSKLFNVLQELQLIDSNPCHLIKRLSEKSGERQVYISNQDFNRILEYLPEWFRPIAQTAYYTGMRRGEIVGLKRKHVDLQKRLIYLGPEDTKEGHWKRVPIHRDLMPILEQILSGSIRSLSGNVFLKEGHPITKPAEMRWCWERKAAKIGLEPCPRFHDLRHAWKTNARRSGMHPEIEKAIMGHSTRARSVHEKYGVIGDEELVGAIDKMTFDHGETKIWTGK